MSVEPSTGTGRATSNGMAVGGLVTGLVGLLISWLIPIVGLILGILGVVLGGIGLSRARRDGGTTGTATAGVVLGALAVIASIVFWVIAYNILTS